MKRPSDFRHRVWDLFDPDPQADRTERMLHGALMILILLNVLAVVLQSVRSLADAYGRWFNFFEYVSVAVFSVEYLARAWSCTADPRYAHPVWGRLRFLISPMALIDLAAILPTLFVLTHLDLRFMRALRLVRLARVAKLGRYSEASNILLRVLKAKREELLLTMSFLLVLSLMCASAMYFVEGSVQPEKFPDIPTAMWWAIVTITTVGYGDVFPVTGWGRVIGVVTTLLGLLMIALPTGVFGAAFVEELNRKKAQPTKCPHCGKDVH